MGLFDFNINRKFKDETKKGYVPVKQIESIEDDGIKFKYSDKTENFTIEQIQNMFPTINVPDYRFVIFWDDTIQFTSLGFLDLFNSEIFKDDSFNYGTFTFLNRKNDYTDGLKFIRETLNQYKHEILERYRDTIKAGVDKANFEERNETEVMIKKNLTYTYEELQELYKKRYWDILTHSPYNGIFNSFLIGMNHFSAMTFVFKHDFEQRKQLIQDIKSRYNKEGRCAIDSITEEEMSVGDILTHYNPNVVFACNIGKVWEAIIDKDLKRIELFSNPLHNGLSDEFTYLLNELSDGQLGPNQCRVYYIDDTIAVNASRD